MRATLHGARPDDLRRRLDDARSGRVVALSHCLLNEKVRRVRRLLTPLFLAYTRWRYRQLAHRVAAELADYRRSGYRVVGIVRVDGSPSCGVQRTLDIDRAVGALASCDPVATDAAAFNERIVLGRLVRGQGPFIDALRHQLRRRRLAVPLYAHDLAGELGGHPGVDALLQRALAR